MRRNGQQALWYITAVACLSICARLGQMDSIRTSSFKAFSASAILLLLLVPLIHLFPFRRSGMIWILGLAVTARILVFPLAPSDDVNRYIWEGRTIAAGFNPYMVAPASPSLIHLRDDIWTGINHREMTAIYPPGALLVFRFLTSVTTSPVGFAAFMAIVDVASVVLLLAWLTALGCRPERALFYALNPLVLLSFAGEGHMDALMITPLLAALVAHKRGKGGWMWFWFALSLHGKYISILLFPFLLRRENFKIIWIIPMVAAIPFAAFWPGTGVFQSLTTFSIDMHYNGSIHRLAALLLNDPAVASRICAGLFLGFLCCLRAMTPRVEVAAAPGFAGLLLFSPTVHFWYLTIIIPFLCGNPIAGLLAWCGTILCSFITLQHFALTGNWTDSHIMATVEYLPVFALLAWAFFHPRRKRLSDTSPPSSLSSLSIILPALNDADMVKRFLSSGIQTAPFVSEVIVCDGGSSDQTSDFARRLGAQVVHSAPGRGLQVAAGIHHARSDVVFIVHADMKIDVEVPGRILDELNRSGLQGGSVGCRFESPAPHFWILRHLNAARAKWFGMSFGDQGQFFRKDILPSLGGFPALPLMEDVELSFRLRAQEKILYLGGGIIVSPRRWILKGFFRNASNILYLLVGYSWARGRGEAESFSKKAYHRYYGITSMDKQNQNK